MAKNDITVELFYSNAWNNVTSDVYTRDPIQITRGRPDEVQRIPPSTLSLSLKNTSGKYSPRNPNSTLYGLIGRNTPIRVSINAGQTFLALAAHTDDRANTPDAASLDITGDLDIRVDLAMDSWTDVSFGCGLASKYNPTGNQRSWAFYVDVDRQLHFRWSADGTATTDVESTIPAPLYDGKRVALRATMDVNNGAAGNTVTFYTAATIDGTWTQLGAPVITPGTTSIFSSTAVLEVGDPVSLTVSNSTGRIYAAQLRDGIGGTIVANPDFRLQTAGASTFADSTGKTWTKQGNTSLSNTDIRFTGEVESWPQRWSVDENDAWAPITANGIMRRLNAPGTTSPSVSALRRAMLVGVLSVGLVTYWPCEEGKDGIQAVSPVEGVAPLVYTSTVLAGNYSTPQAGSLPYATVPNGAQAWTPESFPMPTTSAGFLSFSTTISGTTVTPSTAKAIGNFVMDASFNGGDITRVLVYAYAKWTGTAWDTTNTGVDVLVTGGTPFGSVIGGVGNFNIFDGKPHDIHVRLDQNGADILGQLYIDGILADDATSSTKTLGAIATFKGPVGAPSTSTLGGTAVDNTDTTLSFGHYAFHDDSSVPTFHDAATGHVGETAADRIERLCTEDGISITVVGDPDLSEPVGIQRVAPFLELLNDAAEADGGILYEPRNTLGLAYRTHQSLYNQNPILALDYNAGGEVAPPLDPVEDTDVTGNDITVTRLQGSSATVVRETGPLNVQEPTDDPQGVGRYRRDFTLVLYTDDQCENQASWRRHLGTWDEARYPVVNLDLTAMGVDSKTALISATRDLDLGDRFSITDPPSWLPPEDIVQHAQGYAEILGSHRWSMALNATPALPYEVMSVEVGADNRPRIPAARGATTTNEAMDTTETGMDIISANVRWIDSATYPTHFPFDVMVDGEVMTVTAITGTTLTQTMTVTRSVNGVVKSHASGVDVQLFNAPVLAL